MSIARRQATLRIHASSSPTDTRHPRGRENRGNLASLHTTESISDYAEPERNPFSKEQMEMLQKLFQQTLKLESSSSIATVAQKGNYLSALSACKGRKSAWIVDSGASDHMTGDVTNFNKYLPCHGNSTVLMVLTQQLWVKV